jgi:hypothetical protein
MVAHAASFLRNLYGGHVRCPRDRPTPHCPRRGRGDVAVHDRSSLRRGPCDGQHHPEPSSARHVGPDLTLPYGQLTQAAPIATLGSVLSGLIGGAFYALVSAWMQDEGAPRPTIALFMLAAVPGGLAFQISPLARCRTALIVGSYW